MQVKIDHFLWGVPRLEDGIVQFLEATGVAPVIGGSHPGHGTRNALASLGAGIYFEIIGPDPAQSLEGNLGGAIAAMKSPGLIQMALSTADLTKAAAAFAAAGVAAEIVEESRVTPSGEKLCWRLCEADYTPAAIDAHLPFFIDWMNTPHPADSSPQGCLFSSICFAGPEADRVGRLWDTLGVPLTFEESEVFSSALSIETPRGTVVFAGNSPRLGLERANSDP